jgi:predicted adenylyl cyclase CyaB
MELFGSDPGIKGPNALNETEIKVRMMSDGQTSSVLALCCTLYSDGGQLNQRDEYFDTLEEKLKEQDFTVRLRSVNRNLKVALKGPRLYLPDNVYQRIELEFSAANEREVREQRASQGLTATAVIEKQRWVFSSKHDEIAIDRLPFIGAFIEVEGDTPSAIETVLASLQLSSKDAVRENYSELLEAKFKEISLPLRPGLHATFEAETRWKQDRGAGK